MQRAFLQAERRFKPRAFRAHPQRLAPLPGNLHGDRYVAQVQRHAPGGQRAAQVCRALDALYALLAHERPRDGHGLLRRDFAAAQPARLAQADAVGKGAVIEQGGIVDARAFGAFQLQIIGEVRAAGQVRAQLPAFLPELRQLGAVVVRQRAAFGGGDSQRLRVVGRLAQKLQPGFVRAIDGGEGGKVFGHARGDGRHARQQHRLLARAGDRLHLGQVRLQGFQAVGSAEIRLFPHGAYIQRQRARLAPLEYAENEREHKERRRNDNGKPSDFAHGRLLYTAKAWRPMVSRTSRVRIHWLT